jgi:hypothetical protein
MFAIARLVKSHREADARMCLSTGGIPPVDKPSPEFVDPAKAPARAASVLAIIGDYCGITFRIC